MGINIAEAKARFSELIERVEAGETVEITKRGRPVARIGPTEPKKNRFDAAELASWTAGMTPQKQSASDFVREMRDSDRY